MLIMFTMRAKDPVSDAGYAEVTIVASGLMNAKTHLTKLLKKKDRMDLVKEFRTTKTEAYPTEGVLTENVEIRAQGVPDEYYGQRPSLRLTLPVRDPDSHLQGHQEVVDPD